MLNPGAWRIRTRGLATTASQPYGPWRSLTTRAPGSSNALLRPLNSLACGASARPGSSTSTAAATSTQPRRCGQRGATSAAASGPPDAASNRPRSTANASKATASNAPMPAPIRSAPYNAGIRAPWRAKASPKQLAENRNGIASSRYRIESHSSWRGSQTISRPLNGTSRASHNAASALNANPAAHAANRSSNRDRARGSAGSRSHRLSQVPLAPWPSSAKLMIITANGCQCAIASQRINSSW